MLGSVAHRAAAATCALCRLLLVCAAALLAACMAPIVHASTMEIYLTTLSSQRPVDACAARTRPWSAFTGLVSGACVRHVAEDSSTYAIQMYRKFTCTPGGNVFIDLFTDAEVRQSPELWGRPGVRLQGSHRGVLLTRPCCYCAVVHSP